MWFSSFTLTAEIPQFIYSPVSELFPFFLFVFKLEMVLFGSFSIHVSLYTCARVSLGHILGSDISGSDL